MGRRKHRHEEPVPSATSGPPTAVAHDVSIPTIALSRPARTSRGIDGAAAPAPSPAALLHLQASVGNRAVASLPAIQRQIVVQRDVASAAKELFDAGTKTVKRSDLKGPFKKKHEVADKDVAEIQKALNKLRETAAASAPKKEAPVADVTDPADRPTRGGMVEEDAAKIAELNEWTLVNARFSCTDTSHAPKGKVYTNGSAYYGADNTGHVGWGFKVWEKKDKTTLIYKGNLVWDGDSWKHIARGTK